MTPASLLRVVVATALLTLSAGMTRAEPAPASTAAAQAVSRTYDIASMVFTPLDADDDLGAEIESASLFGAEKSGVILAEEKEQARRRILTAINMLLAGEKDSSAALEESKLTVTASPQKQAAVQALIASHERRFDQPIVTEIRTFKLDEPAVAALPERSREFLIQAIAQGKQRVILAEEDAATLAAVTKGASSMLAPRLTMNDNQRSKVLMGSYVFFNKDFTETQTESGVTVEPTKAAAFTGFRATVQVSADPLARRTALAVSTKISELVRTEERPFVSKLNPAETKLKIETPVLSTVAWSGQVMLNEGESALVYLGKDKHNKHGFMLLATTISAK